MRLVIGISGSSGSIYGVNLVKVCEKMNIETDLIVSPAAEKIMSFEIEENVEEIHRIATRCFDYDDLGAPISSGSIKTDGMVIAPCSMKTVGSIANGITDNLITRAADVVLKENRKLVLVPRETPLNTIHLQNLEKLSRTDTVILPAMPGFYHNPQSINDLVDFILGKILDQFEIEHDLYESWKGLEEQK